MRTKSRFTAVLVMSFIVVTLSLPASACADFLPTPTLPTGTVESSDAAAPSAGEGEPESGPVDSSDGGSVDMQEVLASLLGLASSMLIPLVLTVFIETPIVAIAGHGKRPAWHVGALVNTLTNPIAVLLVLSSWSLIFWTTDWLGVVMIGALEVAIVIAEAFIFARVLGWSVRKSALTSVMANAASFGLGLLTMYGGY